MEAETNAACDNTDLTLWKSDTGDRLILVEGGYIGLDVGGTVLVATPACWHKAGKFAFESVNKNTWRYRLGMWLLGGNRRPNLKKD